MKKLLTGLLILGSVSTFAETASLNDESIHVYKCEARVHSPDTNKTEIYKKLVEAPNAQVAVAIRRSGYMFKTNEYGERVSRGGSTLEDITCSL